MDMARVSIDLGLSKVQSQVGISMMKKTMDLAEQTSGTLVNDMMKAQPPSRSIIDVRA